MTPVPRSDGRSLTRFAASLTLTLVVLAMATWSGGQVEGTYAQGSSGYFDSRLSRVYYSLLAKIKSVQRTVRHLGEQECQTGTLEFKTCPGFNEATSGEITTCVVSPIAGAYTSILDMTVTFNHPFKKPPVVGVSYSGLALLNGKNCSLEVLSVSKNQVVVRQVADDLLPITTQATFFACPSATFDKDDD